MYVEVLVEITNKKLDKTFTYHVNKDLMSSIKIGVRVEVPFQNRVLEGFVLKILNDKEVPEYKTKDIIRVIDDDVILNSELLELGNYLKDKTMSSLMSCYQVMLPKALKAKHGSMINKKYNTYIELVDKNFVPKNSKQNEIIYLLQEGKCEKKILSEVSSSSLKTLLNNNVVREIKEEVYRKKYSRENYVDIRLKSSQIEAVRQIEEDKHLVTLLHGVTGSGKTEVYIELIKHQLENNKKVIVLTPEISLTEQIVNRFLSRFDRIAVLHSRLSDGEKYDEYRRIAKGEVDIVIGARSAVFSPLENIGLIIMDEEQSASYRQDSNPRYHTLDVSMWRMKRSGGKVLLGSATPTLDTYARCLKNVYGLVRLDKRINGKNLPKVEIVDMNDEVKHANSIFSSLLTEKISKHLKNNKQIVLLHNRRGYSSFITCKNCGYAVKCPHCDITLTYHKSSNMLRCHYCSYSEKYSVKCPKCEEEALTNLGTGTEKVEEKLKELFPNVKVLRMDLDTTQKKGMHEKMIKSFKNHEYDILLGTQIVAKGLDFPLVTLVGVINADTSLNIPDFRSSEVTFQLLSQVAGRCGRGLDEGEVVIQTFNKDHYAINYAKEHDYLSFLNKEMKYRKMLGYPPYYYLITLQLSGKNINEVTKEANKVSNFLKEKLTSSIVLGPAPAFIVKVYDVYRMEITIKYKSDKMLGYVLNYLNEHYKSNNKIILDIIPDRMLEK